MSKYRRAKKYLRFIVPALIVMGAILVPKAGHQAELVLGSSVKHHGATNLRVSQAGQQMYTGVVAAELQPAAAPEASTTSTSLSPQQAVPNYCRPYEIPYLDGCITQ